ncbi:LCP family protein [Frondihabitans peucedani]|uniref:LCP family protein n=1 Tax=Frondihabitans peucedani TaxID=598626 RepID=A0ABP8DX76_9MICO
MLPWVAFGLVAILLIGTGYGVYNYQRFVGGVTRIDAITPHSSSTTGTVTDSKAQNILLVGDDHRPAGATAAQMAELGTTQDGGSSNTDTMIVLHLSGDGKKATMISFPRDSYVPIPGHGTGKLNSAFSLGSENGGGDSGGAKLLIQTIEDLSGLSIDHYVRISLLGFYQLVKALGPVSVCLNNAVQDRYSGIDLPAGTSSLDAKEALAFVRQRHGLPRGDLDRQVRQQYFLTVEARQIASAGTLLNPVKLGNVIDAVSQSMQADPGLDFLQLANEMKNLRADDIRSATIPITGTPTITVNGAPLSIVAVDTVGMPAFIQNLFGPPQAYLDAKASSPTATSVTVLNGSGVQGAATAATTALTGLGYKTGPAGSTSVTKQTLVEYPKGQEAGAKAVVARVPGSTAVQTSAVSSVTLVLGTDGRSVTVPSTTPATAPATTPATSPVVPSVPAASTPASQPTPSSTPAGTSYTKSSCIN